MRCDNCDVSDRFEMIFEVEPYTYAEDPLFAGHFCEQCIKDMKADGRWPEWTNYQGRIDQ